MNNNRNLRNILSELTDLSDLISARNIFNVTINNYNGTEEEIIDNESIDNSPTTNNNVSNYSTQPNDSVNHNLSERTIGTIHISSNLNPEPIIYHNTGDRTNISEISNEISNFINTSITSLQNNINLNNSSIPLTIQLLNEKTEILIKSENLEEKCPICNENYEEDIICRKNKLCNHFFHRKCIDEWYSSKNTCPECNQIIN
jgi:hypothetical protein